MTVGAGVERIRIGALVPLSRPGWVQAGRNLLVGLELGVRQANDGGGIDGRHVELMVRDTSGDPRKAEAAVDELAAAGVSALVGGFHSVVARSVAMRAATLGLPYLCSSAVLDSLTVQSTDFVARLAPAQSHGWKIYADFLWGLGHRAVAVAAEPSLYWSSGTAILRHRLVQRGGSVIELNSQALSTEAICDEIVCHGVTALLLLLGHPDPGVPLVQAVRSDPRMATILIGAPAGQPELSDWLDLLGTRGAGVPFLRYLPDRLSPLGSRVRATLAEELGEAPSFVAHEGYDSIIVVAAMLRSQRANGWAIGEVWPRLEVEGSRGMIRFARPAGDYVWQWRWPPIHVADRDPEHPNRFRVVHASA